jgi:hypothetical protein
MNHPSTIRADADLGQAALLAFQPAAMVKVSPVMYRPDSAARYLMPPEMSWTCTHGYRQAALVVFFHQPHCLLQIVGMGYLVGNGVDLRHQVTDDDVGALAGERHRVRLPLASRATSDQSYLAVQFSHVSLL